MQSVIRGAAVSGVVAVVVLVAGLVLKQESGSSQAASGPTKKVTGKAVKVAIRDFKFVPANIAVKPGTKVTFTNYDTAPHTATSKTSGAFDTGSLKKGQSKTVTIGKSGDLKYFCEFHAFMLGDVKSGASS